MKKLFVTFLFVMIAISSCQKQSKTTTLTKDLFPKVYSVIVSEAKSEYPNDSKLRNDAIDMQCLSFNVYLLLVLSDNPSIPRNVLDEFQSEAIVECSERSMSDAPCSNIKELPDKYMDCFLSYMIIDWNKVIVKMNTKIDIYKLNQINM